MVLTCFIINSWIYPHFQATCKALKEADNWTTLTTEIEDDLDGGDLQVVATKLTAIQVWMMGAMCLDSIEKNSGSSFNSKTALLYTFLLSSLQGLQCITLDVNETAIN